jgi:hypothetical protein
MNGYKAFYRNKQMEVRAATSYEAQTKAAQAFKARKSHEVTVVLVEKAGETVSMLRWPHYDASHDDVRRYRPGWFIGSMHETFDPDADRWSEQLRRDVLGWPFAIYRRGAQPGAGDACLCHGIQNLADAEALCLMLNASVGIRSSGHG